MKATGAQVLGRLRANRRTPVLTRLGDGSYLSVIGTEKVRVIDATITVTCADGTVFAGSYRLVTTLTDARRYPAAVLAGIYHQRWEHESAYYALRHTIMNGRVLRSGDPAGVEQEMWALLTLYQTLRTVMVEAAESLPGADPDRCCFTVALQTARDQVVQAAASASGYQRPGPGEMSSQPHSTAWPHYPAPPADSRSCPTPTQGPWRTRPRVGPSPCPPADTASNNLAQSPSNLN